MYRRRQVLEEPRASTEPSDRGAVLASLEEKPRSPVRSGRAVVRNSTLRYVLAQTHLVRFLNTFPGVTEPGNHHQRLGDAEIEGEEARPSDPQSPQ